VTVHPKVLSATGWTLVRELVRERLVEGWVLAGGTGLALQLGHRVSEDLDFFRVEPFEPEGLALGLSRLGQLEVQSRSAGTLHASLRGIRLSFVHAEAPLLFPGTPYRGLWIADPRDVAVMKVIAIGGRGSRKDFVDLFFFLRGGGSIEAIFEMIRRRFANIDFNEYHLLRSLTFFEDAETEPMPRLLRQVDWSEIKKAIIAEVRRID
jgi:hypothetical protein